MRGAARPALTWCMPAGHVAGSLPAGLAPCSPSRTLAMASPVAWAGKKQARMAPTPSCPCAQLTSRGPALKSSRMRGRPAAAGTRGVTTSPVPRQLRGMGHSCTVLGPFFLLLALLPLPLGEPPAPAEPYLPARRPAAAPAAGLAAPNPSGPSPPSPHLSLRREPRKIPLHPVCPPPRGCARALCSPLYLSPGTPAPRRLPAPPPPPLPSSTAGTAAAGTPPQS